MELISRRTPLALLLVCLGTIGAAWWWLAKPIVLARAPIDPDAKLMCVSYAPFRGEQTPLTPATQVTAEQIAERSAIVTHDPLPRVSGDFAHVNRVGWHGQASPAHEVQG